MDNFEEIKIKAPGPGTCKLCATVHRPEEPHDRDSLYYQHRFRLRYKRFPTWEDAMAHCSEDMKARYAAKLARRGIFIVKNHENGE